jgi:hypothetical protein
MVASYDQAALPLLDRLGCEQQGHSRDQGIPTRLCETHQEQSCVRSGYVSARVGEVQVLGDQKAIH